MSKTVRPAIRFNTPDVWGIENYPYCQAAVEPAGHRVHVAGQVAWTIERELVGPDDPTAQTEKTIDNIETILSAMGGSIHDVISVTMYYVRDEDLAAIRDVRGRRFGLEHGPASTGVKVAGLVRPELLVEMSAIAVIPEARFKL
ncbi:RidA family protein [uncultured Roseobacter sp.]|uniref:RidA family protein n=1 Tax=uncultured Roseobacter sp. TaxID=114847 RepID=UPI00262498F8|nr:RidA family protein [uncultured Roseobacter sp.]